MKAGVGLGLGLRLGLGLGWGGYLPDSLDVLYHYSTCDFRVRVRARVRVRVRARVRESVIIRVRGKPSQTRRADVCNRWGWVCHDASELLLPPPFDESG